MQGEVQREVPGHARSPRAGWARPASRLPLRLIAVTALALAALGLGLLVRPLSRDPLPLLLLIASLGLPLGAASFAAARSSALSGEIARLRAGRQEADDELASMAHDLKGPLSTVSSYLDLIAEGALGPVSDDARAAARRAAEASARVRALVESALLQHVEAIAARPPSGVTPVDLRALIRDVTEALRAELAASHAEIVVEPLPGVLGEPGRLFRVFENLVQNAVKYARPGEAPMVMITGAPRGDRAEIVVRDHGIGIPAEDAERVFDSAARAANGIARASGSGLGLATARRLVRDLGGEIWIDQGDTGEGVAIRLSLPLAR